MSPLPPRILIHNRYRSLRLINQGGFGAVYEALDQTLNRKVALKQLLLTGENMSRHFKREAQLLANLEHPALPRVTDHFTDPAGQFLVMDYIPGQDLAERMQQQGVPFPVSQVLDWGLQLLDVLDFLHTHEPSIIHRDIKPPNLKVGTDGRIKLLDFGLAKGYAGDFIQMDPQPSIRAYTNGFAAPEQISQAGTDARTDLYALGATLYYLLTNVPPADAQQRSESIKRNRHDPLQPPHKLIQGVPEAISYILVQSLALTPAMRQQSAREMKEQLQEAGRNRGATYTTRSLPISKGEHESVPTHSANPGRIVQPNRAEANDQSIGRRFRTQKPARKRSHRSGKALTIPKQPRKSLLLLGSGTTLIAVAAILVVLVWASSSHETLACPPNCLPSTPTVEPTASPLSGTVTNTVTKLIGMDPEEPAVQYVVKAWPIELGWSDPNGKLGEGESYEVILTAPDKSLTKLGSKELTLTLDPSNIHIMPGTYLWQVVRVRQKSGSTGTLEEISNMSGSRTFIIGSDLLSKP